MVETTSSIKIYYTSVSGSREVKQRQEEVIRILDTYKIKYELVDISTSLKALEEMRTKVSTPKALPPQIFNGEEYCGDFEMFRKAKEKKDILKFLKMERMGSYDKR
uniref:SH3 domain-binding glutamic acid-rich-like protein n=1 Tax=Castor canadensis TaxID=51338 RepID=A0A8C0XP27_CASCN